MSRHVFTFLGTFVAGALLALVARAAWFNPNTGHSGHPASGGDYAPMVANTTPGTATANTATAHDDHAAQAGTTPAATAAANSHADHAPDHAEPVNTICAICGMEVDPDLPTAEYQGRTIGFGCRACPPKFKANPDKYGPAYLRNEVIKG